MSFSVLLFIARAEVPGCPARSLCSLKGFAQDMVPGAGDTTVNKMRPARLRGSVIERRPVSPSSPPRATLCGFLVAVSDLWLLAQTSNLGPKIVQDIVCILKMKAHVTTCPL